MTIVGAAILYLDFRSPVSHILNKLSFDIDCRYAIHVLYPGRPYRLLVFVGQDSTPQSRSGGDSICHHYILSAFIATILKFYFDIYSELL